MSMYFGEHSIRFYPVIDDQLTLDDMVMYTFDGPEQGQGNPEHDSVVIMDTWKHWHLIPTEKPIIKPPEMEFNMLKIPGRHGVINPNKYTYGTPIFGSRKGSIEFILDPDYIRDWPVIYSEMMQFFHGQERRMVLRDDPYYYYQGWFTVSDLTPDEYGDTVTLTYELDPFKYERWTSGGVWPWLWDDFDFRTGVIRDFSDITVSGEAGEEIPPLHITETPFGVDCIPTIYAENVENISDHAKGSDKPLRGLWDAIEAIPIRRTPGGDYSTAYVVVVEQGDTAIDVLSDEGMDDVVLGVRNAALVHALNSELQDAAAELADTIDAMCARARDEADTDEERELRDYDIHTLLPYAAMMMDNVWTAAESGIVQASVDGETWVNVFKSGNDISYHALAVGGAMSRRYLHLRTTIDTTNMEIVPMLTVFVRGNML